MPDYALVIRHKEEYWDELSPEVRDDILRRYFAWFDDLREREVLQGAHSLHDGGRLIKIVDGKVVDGPYTETKEIVGGFVLVRVETWDEAAAIARACPALEVGDAVELRRVSRHERPE